MGLQHMNKNVFRGFGNLVIWLWRSLGSMFREACKNPDGACFAPIDAAVYFTLFCVFVHLFEAQHIIKFDILF